MAALSHAVLTATRIRLWAPVVVYLASVMTLLVIPFAPGLFGADLNIGLLYFFAVSGLGVVGLLMAGWSSYNKYSLLGGLRAAARHDIVERLGERHGHRDLDELEARIHGGAIM